MNDATNFRRDRIEKLLGELRYEVERGLAERDIAEEMTFRFYVPFSAMPGGVVFCEFRTRPIPDHAAPEPFSEPEPRLRLGKVWSSMSK